jgi:molecular chaperone DnaK (HSP70)
VLKARMRLKKECEKVKRQLSNAQDATIDVTALFDGEDLDITITRNKFESIAKELFDKIMPICDKAIEDAGLKKEEIVQLVMVGGSSRIPKV